MRLTSALCVAALAFQTLASPAFAQGFKFNQPTEDDLKDQAAEQARQDRIYDQLSTPCRAQLKDKKIMLIIGEERSAGVIYAVQQNYGRHYQALNARLRSVGLRTYTPEQIRAQIAQAEIDAYFKNDPDAALSASRRLGANFILRGFITRRASRNPMIPVNQVAVTMDFTLTDTGGRVLSDTSASNSSYAGADLAGMALTLVNEKADDVVAQLYSDYCRNAGFAGKAKAK
ncbi:MAG TPA: hypothetical protein VMV45_11280 [Casimicrobiaceae bacterium]|nr:hypothetical protein [Casimicrobiaceae bacterium]